MRSYCGPERPAMAPKAVRRPVSSPPLLRILAPSIQEVSTVVIPNAGEMMFPRLGEIGCGGKIGPTLLSTLLPQRVACAKCDAAGRRRSRPGSGPDRCRPRPARPRRRAARCQRPIRQAQGRPIRSAAWSCRSRPGRRRVSTCGAALRSVARSSVGARPVPAGRSASLSSKPSLTTSLERACHPELLLNPESTALV